MTGGRAGSLTLPGTRESVGAARRFVAETLREVLPEDVVDTATLLASEVVTNAVLHAGSDTCVDVTLLGEGVLVRVEDRGTSVPVPRRAAADAVSGRGLTLVEGLADDYGVLSTPAGKAVWFTLGGARRPGPSGWRLAGGGPADPRRGQDRPAAG